MYPRRGETPSGKRPEFPNVCDARRRTPRNFTISPSCADPLPARMRHASKIQDATLQRTRAARGNGNNDNNNNRAREISVALPRSWKVPFPLSSRKKKRRNKSESFQESDGGYRDRLFYVSLIFFLRWNYENGGGRVWI